MARRKVYRQIGHDEKRRSGLSIQHDTKRHTIRLFGWYDTFVGIDPIEMPLIDFLLQLDIRREDFEERE